MGICFLELPPTALADNRSFSAMTLTVLCPEAGQILSDSNRQLVLFRNY